MCTHIISMRRLYTQVEPAIRADISSSWQRCSFRRGHIAFVLHCRINGCKISYNWHCTKNSLHTRYPAYLHLNITQISSVILLNSRMMVKAGGKILENNCTDVTLSMTLWGFTVTNQSLLYKDVERHLTIISRWLLSLSVYNTIMY
jgi:hypothetical protein